MLAVYRIIIVLCGVVAFMPISKGMAQDASVLHMPKAYVSAFLDRHSLGLNDNNVELKPVVGSAAVGYWIRDGIGVELEAGFGVSDDSVGRLDVDHVSTLGASLRLESPPISRFAAYALFGYVRTSYDADTDDASSSVSLPGGRMVLGVTYMLTPKLVLDTAFTHHDYDKEVRINSFRLGVRFDLGS